MKISIKNRIIASLLACLTLSSCSNWLDVTPEVNIKDEDLFKKEEGFFDALVGGYALTTSASLYGDKLTLSFLDVLACNYSVDDKSLKSFYYAIQYDYLNTNTRPIIDGIWGGIYTAIANINNLLEYLDHADRSLFSENNYELIRGEALALRAYLHFDLARMFGPVPGTDDGKKFMPYIKTIGKENTPYSSLAEVFEQVLVDLQVAQELLVNDPITVNNFTTNNTYLMFRKDHLNFYAVEALKARVYLYKGEPENARACAENVITGQNTVTLMSSVTDLDKDRLFSQEMLFSLFVDNIGKISDGYYLPSSGEQGELKLKENYLKQIFEADKYDKKDSRYEYQFQDMEGYPRLVKYRQLTTDRPGGRYRVPMLRLSEMYYISAECSPSVDSAAVRINQVRTARRLPSLEFTAMTEVNDYLQKEYRREFYAEGQLFFYYKRRNIQVIPDSEIDIAGKTAAVYTFPLPDREVEYGNK